MYTYNSDLEYIISVWKTDISYKKARYDELCKGTSLSDKEKALTLKATIKEIENCITDLHATMYV